MYQKLLTRLLGIFDIPSGPIVGLWSLTILVGCIFSILKTHEVSSPVATIFSVVITNFAGHKMIKVWKGRDQDNQGDNNGNDSTKPQS
jgi:hypothetical protein